MSKTEDIIENEILKHTNISKEELERKIQEKIEEFGGIIKREAALIVLAKELGIPIPRENFSQQLSALRIKDLAVGFRGIDVEGIVISRQPLLKSSAGKEYLRFALADENDAIWVIAWGEKALELDPQLKIGQKILLSRASVRKYRDKKEIVLDKNSTIRMLENIDTSTIMELSRKLGFPLTLVEVVKSFSDETGITLYGYNNECRPSAVRVLSKDPRLKISEGDTVLLSNCTINTFDNYSQVTCRPSSYLQKLDKKQTCFERDMEELFISGILLGYEVFSREGGKIYLLTNTGVKSIVFFRDELLAEASNLILRGTLVWGYRKIDDALREIAYTKLEGGEQIFPAFERNKRFLEVEGFIETRANIVSIDLNRKCRGAYNLFSIYVTLDDGTSTIKFLSNSSKILHEVFSLSQEELCDYTNDVIEEIIAYRQDELGGEEATIRGYISRRQRVSFLVEISPTV